jgi:hypothetical protein
MKSDSPKLSRRRKSHKKRRELVGLLISVVLAFVFGVIPMPVAWRWLLWFCCWLVCLYVITLLYRPLDALPVKTRTLFIVSASIGFLAASNSLALSMWMQEHSNEYSGELVAHHDPSTKRQNLPDTDVRFQIGPDGTQLIWTGTIPRADWSPPRSRLTMERVNGKLLLTADVRDKTNALIARIENNHWEVSPSNSWEHNYTDDSLEVKDKTGKVVLKTRVFQDRVQIEGEWWNEDGLGIRMLRPYPYDPIATGPVFVISKQSNMPDEPSIQDMFQYPAKDHLGELKDSHRRWFDSIFILRALGS